MILKLPAWGYPPRTLTAMARRIARTLGMGVMLIGVGVLVGWMFGLDYLTSVDPGLITMKPLTAIGFIMAGGGLWISRCLPSGERTADQKCLSWPWLKLLLLASLGLGMLGLVEALLNINTGLGDLIF